MKLFYIRHGDPCYEPDSLTPLGKRQAEAIARRLASESISSIYASTSIRAIETATPLSEIIKKDIIKLEWCEEYLTWKDFSAANDDGNRTWCFYIKKYRELFNTPKIKSLGNEWYNASEFLNDSFKNGVERINKETDNFFLNLGYIHDRETGKYIIKNNNDSNIALFAHQGFGLAFISSLLDIPYPLFATHFDILHTGLTVIEFKDEGGYSFPKVTNYSDTGHLYAERLIIK